MESIFHTQWPVGLSDLLRACEILGITEVEEGCADVAVLLGLQIKLVHRRSEKRVPPKTRIETPRKALAPDKGGEPRQEETSQKTLTGDKGDEPGPTVEVIDFEIETAEEATPRLQLPEYVVAAEPLQKDPVLQPLIQPSQPLFPIQLTRGILRKHLAVEFFEGEPDIDCLVKQIATGMPLQTIPRRGVLSLRRGVHVLWDTSESMLPYAEDQRHLVVDLTRLFGLENVAVTYFHHTPQTVDLDEEQQGPFDYTTLHSGTPVLLLSDFGIGRPPFSFSPGPQRDWLDFNEMCRRLGVPVTAFLPYNIDRCPSTLKNRMRLVHWDRPRLTGPPAIGEMPVHQPMDNRIGKLVARLARRNPAAVQLALALSLASKIERALLREARVHLVTNADAGAEADLMFSDLVENYNTASMGLVPDVQAYLRAELKNSPERLEEIWAFLKEYRKRQNAPHATRIEEKLSYLACRGDDPTPNLQDELGPVIQSLLIPEIRTEGLTYWALRVVSHLPKKLLDNPVVHDLLKVAHMRQLVASSQVGLSPDTKEEWVALAAHALPKTAASVHWVKGKVIVADGAAANERALSLPDTQPRVLNVSFPGSDREKTTYSFFSGGQVEIPAHHGPIAIGTLDEKICQLVAKPTKNALIILVGGDRGIEVFQVSNGTLVYHLETYGRVLPVLAFHGSTGLIAFQTPDLRLCVWDAFHDTASMSEHSEETITALDFSPTGQTLSVGTQSGKIILWDILEKQIKDTFEASEDPIMQLAFSPHGSQLCSCSKQGDVSVWDIDTSIQVERISSVSATQVAYSPDGELLALGNRKAAIHILDAKENKPILHVKGHKNIVRAVCFNPNGSLLASAADDGTVRLWDLPSGKNVRTFTWHGELPRHVAFGPQANGLLAIGDKNTVRMWNAHSGTEWHRLQLTQAKTVLSVFGVSPKQFRTGAKKASDKPLRVYISSTYRDNVQRRKLVNKAITRAGMVWHGMDIFATSTRPTVDECVRLAGEADLLVGIIARRYGWIPDGHEKSIVELEYEAAKERLMFILDESSPVNPEIDFDQGPDRLEKQLKLEKFKQRIRDDQMAAVFTETTLLSGVLVALQKWRDRLTYELLKILGGEFMMGSPEAEKDRYGDEGPLLKVKVSDFYMGRFPVTNEEYGRFMKEETDISEPKYWADRRFNQPRQPVVGVSWDDAKRYASWAGLRLPSEAEWEFACRSNTRTRYYKGDTENDLDRAGWYQKNSDEQTHPIGEKEPNDFGLYDMHGNVWEWVEDDWHFSYAGAPDDGRAWIDEPRGANRVLRGGCWDDNAQDCRSAIRAYVTPVIRDYDVGFRLASSIARSP